MSFLNAIKAGFVNWKNFQTRARPSECWWWALFFFIVMIVSVVIDMILFGTTQMIVQENGGYTTYRHLSGGDMLFFHIAVLILIVPTLAVSVRRLHDLDKSGWWYLINVIPLIGPITFMVLAARPGSVGPNRFGAPR